MVENKRSEKEQEVEQALRNREQEKLNEKEPNAKKEGRGGGGLVKGIFNFIKGIFSATIDMPQQGQFGNREANSDQQSEIQGQWISGAVNREIVQDTQKNPKDLDQKRVEKAAEGLKEVVTRDTGDSDRSIEGMAPNQTPAKDTQKKEGPQVSS